MKKLLIIIVLLTFTFGYSQDPCLSNATMFPKIGVKCKTNVTSAVNSPIITQNPTTGVFEPIAKSTYLAGFGNPFTNAQTLAIQNNTTASAANYFATLLQLSELNLQKVTDGVGNNETTNPITIKTTGYRSTNNGYEFSMIQDNNLSSTLIGSGYLTMANESNEEFSLGLKSLNFRKFNNHSVSLLLDNNAVPNGFVPTTNIFAFPIKANNDVLSPYILATTDDVKSLIGTTTGNDTTDPIIVKGLTIDSKKTNAITIGNNVGLGAGGNREGCISIGSDNVIGTPPAFFDFGHYATGIGHNIQNYGEKSILLGKDLYANGTESVILGNNINTNSSGSIILGRNISNVVGDNKFVLGGINGTTSFDLSGGNVNLSFPATDGILALTEDVTLQKAVDNNDYATVDGGLSTFSPFNKNFTNVNEREGYWAITDGVSKTSEISLQVGNTSVRASSLGYNSTFNASDNISITNSELSTGHTMQIFCKPANYSKSSFWRFPESVSVGLTEELVASREWVNSLGFGTSSGTVTSVIGTDGVTVATGTTTPVIGLGAIVPASVYGITPSIFAFVDPTSSIQTQLNAKELISNKQTNLTASATKYPTVDAVNTGLGLKQDVLGFVPYNSTNPNGYQTSTQVQTIADAKVVNDLIASTTLAPSKTAVNTGLALKLTASNNLSDLTNVATAKTNLALNNVDNTTDANKPISSATATALAGKQAILVSGTNIKTINGTSILGTGDIAISTIDATKLAIANNLSDLASITTARTNLGLGTLATQSGTFSGTSSGTNTGDNAVNSLYSGLVSNATHTGDATGSTALVVKGINGTLMSSLATGIVKNTTTTGVPSIAVAGTDYALPNANTTGTASTITGSITESQVTGLVTDLSNKQATLGGTGFVRSTAGVISYDTNTYLTSVPAQSFASLTGKPTTLGGYGITDFNSLGDARWSLLAHTHTFASLTAIPTTLAGYGITDAYPLTGNPSAFLTASGTATNFSGVLAGEVTGTQGATVVGNSAVTGKVLTGFTSGAGTVLATDTILQALQKINGNDALKLATNGNGSALTGLTGSQISGNIAGNSTNVTGTIAVANGGTGAVTLTGYVKGAGTAVMTASATIPTTDLTGTLATAQFPALTGDVTNTAGSLATTLANVGTAGTYDEITFNAKGLETSGLKRENVVTLASAFSSSAINTTLSNVTGWTFPVVTGKNYSIEIIADYQTVVTTTGGTLGVNLSTGAGTIRGKFDGEIVQTTGATGLRASIRAIGANALAGSFMTTTGVGTINSPHYIGGKLIFSCVTSGTLNVSYNSEVAASASQLNAGSTLIYKLLN
jgi:hypothetical protein